MSNNSPLPSAMATQKVAWRDLMAAREEAVAVSEASKPGLEVLRAAVNRARKQGVGLEEAIGRLHAAEVLLLGPAMAMLAETAKAYAEAAEALAAATSEGAIRPLKVEAA